MNILVPLHANMSTHHCSHAPEIQAGLNCAIIHGRMTPKQIQIMTGKGQYIQAGLAKLVSGEVSAHFNA